MKIKQIREMIRQSILAEYNINEDTNIQTGDPDPKLKDEYDFLKEASLNPEDIKRKYNEMFGKNPSTKFTDVAKALGRSEEEVTMALMGVSLPKLEEAEEEEISDEETVDIEAPAPDVPADMPADTTMVAEPTYTPEEAAVMSDLDDALKSAQEIGDEKLETLIGNIITYFTRQHVVKEGEAGRKKHYKGAVKDDEDQISKLKKDMKFDKKQLKTESLEILKMKKLAGLLTEGEYAKALLKEEKKNLTPLQQYIYNYEVEISGEDNAEDELENIKKLNNPEDVYNYYAVYRGWEQDKDFKYDLKNIYNQVKRKFTKLKENNDSEDDTYGDPYTAANYVYQYNKQFDPFEPQKKERNPSKSK